MNFYLTALGFEVSQYMLDGYVFLDSPPRDTIYEGDEKVKEEKLQTCIA